MNRAPWKPSSPGWSMSTTRPAIWSRRSMRSRAAPSSMVMCVSWPQACITPGEFRGEIELGVLGQGQRVHVGTQDRRRSGLPALDHRDHGADRLAGHRIEPESPELSDERRLGARQLQADLRVTVQLAADLDQIRQDAARGTQELGGSHVQRSHEASPFASSHRPTVRSSRSNTTPSSARAAAMKRSSIAIRDRRPTTSGCIVTVSTPPGSRA